MKCTRCGYDDHGTGDFSHGCSTLSAVVQSLPPPQPGQPEGCNLPALRKLNNGELRNVIEREPETVFVRLTDVEAVVAEEAAKLRAALAARQAPTFSTPEFSAWCIEKWHEVGGDIHAFARAARQAPDRGRDAARYKALFDGSNHPLNVVRFREFDDPVSYDKAAADIVLDAAITQEGQAQ